MESPWIIGCMVQRVALHDGLVLDLDGYNEIVITSPLRLTLPAYGHSPGEEVTVNPADVAAYQRPVLDVAGSVCTYAACDESGALHLEFSTGEWIDVAADEHAIAWKLYGKRHGYMVCLPQGRVRAIRHDLPEADESGAEAGSLVR
ncbi:MAG TPA: DUF6188 family protein [Mycobacterium sp.]|nr:DUF6188 family protein [Mycobacterium sp.]